MSQFYTASFFSQAAAGYHPTSTFGLIHFAMKQERFIVYMVDDDADDLEILSEAFEASGCASEIKCFISGIELLHLMQSRKIEIPDIIIMDHYLSANDQADMPGIIRSEKQNDNITLVVYSSSLSPVRIEQLLQRGVDLCRHKGNSMEGLKVDVEAFCEAIKNKKQTITE